MRFRRLHLHAGEDGGPLAGPLTGSPDEGPDDAAAVGPEIEHGSDGRVTPESLAAVREAAERGLPVAMSNYGTALHAAGDQVGALHWYARSWEAGNVVAGFNLGTLHWAAGNRDQAWLVWEEAAVRGDVDAMLALVRMALERDDRPTIERWVPRIYSQDLAFPITAVGVAFGSRGYTSEALRAFTIAGDLGDAYAMNYRAEILEARGEHEQAGALRARAAEAEHLY
jgi:tetratricopeptide (TPR) repeat protein